MSSSAFFGKKVGAGAGASSSSSSSDSSAGHTAAPSKALPWVEKYRPKGLQDVASQEDIVRALTNSVRTGNIPHMLFYGPPGTGKTSTVLAMARDLYGPELMKTRVMELNASDERGIAVIREKVKTFAQSSVGASVGVAPFKLIVLDEADSLTPDAQAALRRTMETYSKVTRFAILCNYVSRIIEPLASRCSKFRFRPLDSPSMMTRLRLVCDGEGGQLAAASEDTLSEILRISGGDMRKAITFLQSAASLYGTAGITPERVLEISGVYPDSKVADAVNTLRTGSFDAVRNSARTIISQGYGLTGVLEKLTEALISAPDSEVPLAAKVAIAERAGGADKRLADGADEELQLSDFMLLANRAIKGALLTADGERKAII